MFWGGFACNRTISIAIFNNKTNFEAYKYILSEDLFPKVHLITSAECFYSRVILQCMLHHHRSHSLKKKILKINEICPLLYNPITNISILTFCIFINKTNAVEPWFSNVPVVEQFGFWTRKSSEILFGFGTEIQFSNSERIIAKLTE